ncbi:MAG: YigZ family protein [Ornithinimicrobium sp.]
MAPASTDRAAPTPAFTTLAAPACVEIEVKRSRFLCIVQRVDSEDAARDLIAATRKRHWDAGHHCSAMILGADRALERSSDDGEPAGTAGAPMLEVLRGRELSDVVAVVSRWFGGTKLGTGGLARAYGDAVRSALESAVTLRCVLVEEFLIEVDHATAGRLENDLRARGVDVLATQYAERARISLGIPAGRRDELESTLAELTSGSVDLQPSGSIWRDTP